MPASVRPSRLRRSNYYNNNSNVISLPFLSQITTFSSSSLSSSLRVAGSDVSLTPFVRRTNMNMNINMNMMNIATTMNSVARRLYYASPAYTRVLFLSFSPAVIENNVSCGSSLMCVQRRCVSTRHSGSQQQQQQQKQNQNLSQNQQRSNSNGDYASSTLGINTPSSSLSSSSSVGLHAQNRAQDDRRSANRQNSTHRFSSKKSKHRDRGSDKKGSRNFGSKLQEQQKQHEKHEKRHRFASRSLDATKLKESPHPDGGSSKGKNRFRHRHVSAAPKEDKIEDVIAKQQTHEDEGVQEVRRPQSTIQNDEGDRTVEYAVGMVSSAAFTRFLRRNLSAMVGYSQQTQACAQMLHQSNVLTALCLVANASQSSEHHQQHPMVCVEGMRVSRGEDDNQTESSGDANRTSTDKWESFNLQPTVLYATPIRFPPIAPALVRENADSSTTQSVHGPCSLLDVVDWRSAPQLYQEWTETVVDKPSRRVLNALFGACPLSSLVSLAHALARIIQNNHELSWESQARDADKATTTTTTTTKTGSDGGGSAVFPSAQWFENRWQNEKKKRGYTETSETQPGNLKSPEYLRFLEEELTRGSSEFVSSTPHVDSIHFHSDAHETSIPADGTVVPPRATVHAIEVSLNLIIRYLQMNWFSLQRDQPTGLDRLFLYPIFVSYGPHAVRNDQASSEQLACVPPNPTHAQKIAYWRHCVGEAVESDIASAAGFWKLMAILRTSKDTEISCDEWLDWFSFAVPYFNTSPASVVAMERRLVESGASETQPMTYASVAMRNLSMHISRQYASVGGLTHIQQGRESPPIWNNFSEMFYPSSSSSSYSHLVRQQTGDSNGKGSAGEEESTGTATGTTPSHSPSHTTLERKGFMFTPATRRILEATPQRQLFGRWLLGVYVDVLERGLVSESTTYGGQNEIREGKGEQFLPRIEKLSRSSNERRKVPSIVRKVVGYDESYTLLWHFLAITQPNGLGNVAQLGIPKPYELTRSFIMSLSAGSTALWTTTDSNSKIILLFMRRALTCRLIGEMLSAAANSGGDDGNANTTSAHPAQSTTGICDYLQQPCPSTIAFLCTSSSIPVLTVQTLQAARNSSEFMNHFEPLVRDALQVINGNAQLKQLLTRYTAAKHQMGSEKVTSDSIAAHTFALLETGILSSLIAADQRLSASVHASDTLKTTSDGIPAEAVKRTPTRIESAFQDTFRDKLVSRITSLSFLSVESDSAVIRTAVRALYEAFRAFGSFRLDDDADTLGSSTDQTAHKAWIEFRRALSLFFNEENEAFILQKLRSLDQIGELQKSIQPVNDPVLSQLRVAVSISRHSETDALSTLEEVLWEVDGVYSSKLKGQNIDAAKEGVASAESSVSAQSWTVAELEIVVAAVYLSFTRSATHALPTTVLHHRTPATSLQFSKKMLKTMQALLTYKKMSSSAIVGGGGGETGASAVRHSINSRNVVFIPLAVQSANPEAIFSMTPLERSLNINCVANMSKFALTSLLEAVLLGLLPLDMLGKKYRELEEMQPSEGNDGKVSDAVHAFLSPISDINSSASRHLRNVAARVVVCHLPALLSRTEPLVGEEEENVKGDGEGHSLTSLTLYSEDVARFLSLLLEALVGAELSALTDPKHITTRETPEQKVGDGPSSDSTSTSSLQPPQKLSLARLQEELLRAQTLALYIHINANQASQTLIASRAHRERNLLLGILLSIIEGIQDHPGACSVADSLCLWSAASARSCGIVFSPHRRVFWPTTSLSNHLYRPQALNAATLGPVGSPPSNEDLACVLQDHVYYAISRCVALIQSELTNSVQLPRPAFIACVCAALHAVSTLGIDIDAESAHVEALLARGFSERRVGTQDISLLLNCFPATNYSRSAFLPVAAALRLMRHNLGIYELDRAFIALNLVADSWDSHLGVNRLGTAGKMNPSHQTASSSSPSRGHPSEGVPTPNADAQTETLNAKLPSSAAHGASADDADRPSFHAQLPAMRTAPVQLRHAWAAVARRMMDEFPSAVPTQTLVNALCSGPRMNALDGSLFFQIFSYVCEARSHDLDIGMWTMVLTSINDSKISSVVFTRPQALSLSVRPRILNMWEGIRDAVEQPSSVEENGQENKNSKSKNKRKRTKSALQKGQITQASSSSPVKKLHQNDLILFASSTKDGDPLVSRNISVVLCPLMEVLAELFPADEEMWNVVTMCVKGIVARNAQDGATYPELEESVNTMGESHDRCNIQKGEDSINLLMSLEWSLRTAGLHRTADSIMSEMANVLHSAAPKS